VEKTGFKKYVREGINLSSADKLGLDVTLDLGAVAESVTVTAEASLLQTESSARLATIQNRAIEDIPTNGRNLYQLQFTLPGVVKTSRYWGSMEFYAFGNVNGVMISGGRQNENETLVDGSSNTRGDRGVAWVPSLNSIQEFTVQSNAYVAQFRRVGGQLTGDFSTLMNSAGARVTIYDPATTTLGSAGKYTRQPFGGNVIPGNRINPVAAKVASFYPKPTSAGIAPDNNLNYTKVQPARNGYDAWLGKMDYHVNQSNRISWRYAQTPLGELAQNRLGGQRRRT
jgi:hypothetical protein